MQDIADLSVEDIERDFKFILTTPAHGAAYYCEQLDCAAVVYATKVRVFSHRIMDHGICPSSFQNNIERNV
jgi:hypothetical protein